MLQGEAGRSVAVRGVERQSPEEQGARDQSAEESVVRFGETTIAYSIRRGRRQKTVAVAVDPVEGVYVIAPRETSIERLDQIVHRKARWIVERRRRQEDLPPPPSPRDFVSGETFLYLGRQYRLKVEKRSAGEQGVRLVGGFFRVPFSGTSGRRSEVRRGLVEWYRQHAALRLPERVELWGPGLGLEPAAVLIREPKKRWGSADAKGQLRFNWRVVQAPIRLVDYVVAHELVHLRHPHHTAGFWSALGEVMPDYEVRREALRRVGSVMIW